MKTLALAALLSLAAFPALAKDDFADAPRAGGIVGQINNVKKQWSGGAQAAPFAFAAPEADLTPEQALQTWSHACPAIAAYRASTHDRAKRGLGVTTHYAPGSSVLSYVGASWYYTWTAAPAAGGAGEFVPLLQYPNPDHRDKDLATLKNDLGALPPGTKHLLGFNEPDLGPKSKADNAPPAPDGAEKLMLRLMGMIPAGVKTELKIGSPALASPVVYRDKRPEVASWQKDYDAAAEHDASSPDARRDFIATHLYSAIVIEKTDSPEAAAAKVKAAAKGFLDRLHTLEDAYPGKEIWITEMGLMDPHGPKSADEVSFGAKDDACFMAETLSALDHDTRVARYAWFNADPAAAKPHFKTLPGTLYSGGKMTPLALLYKQ
jgi:hypothetical protein